MKYLVISKRNTLIAPSTKEWLAMLQATNELAIAWLEDGTIECSYGTVPADGGMTIVNADSHEQAQEVLTKIPLFPFYTWTIQPVIEMLSIYDRFIELYKQQIG